MVVTTPPSRGVRSWKRKREIEEAIPSADAVSEKILKEMAPMVLARWKTAICKGSSATRRLVEVLVKIEASTTPGPEEDFKPHKANAKWGSTRRKMWEVGIQVTMDPLERGATRNSDRPWWIALETTKELENCLKELDRGASRKCLISAT